MTAESLPLPLNVISSDPLPTAIIPHIHDYEETCTTACPASPDYDTSSPFTFDTPSEMEPDKDEELDPILMEVTKLKLQVAFLSGKIDSLVTQQAGIAGMLEKVVDQVGPTLDQISSNPMFKMMFGGK